MANATVELTWEPPWDKEMISEAGKLVLNIF
jgi:metal-sulfur cluster biosynthetic enzyme